MSARHDVPAIDLALLSGFDFLCRPDCGLCCYAEPRVDASERRRLLQIVPEAEFVGREADTFLTAAPEGGACRLLEDNRCRAHPARPHPCREYPLTVHVGTRLQATVVLSCPGVDLTPLGRLGTTVARHAGSGFSAELAALLERVDDSSTRRLESTARRHRKIVRSLEHQGRWEEEEDVRTRLREALPLPEADDFPVEEPPAAEDGIERLPLFFDRGEAPVAISSGLGGWEFHEVSPHGGFARSLGVIPPPERPPRIEGGADSILRGYLGYWLERDALFGTVHLRMLESTVGTVTEWVAGELRAIGALVLARAEVRAKLARGSVDRLTAEDLRNGVRASDQDLLDRDSWGERF